MLYVNYNNNRGVPKMRDFAPRFAPAAVSARGDFRAFLSRVYKKDYSAYSAEGFYVVLCTKK